MNWLWQTGCTDEFFGYLFWIVLFFPIKFCFLSSEVLASILCTFYVCLCFGIDPFNLNLDMRDISLVLQIRVIKVLGLFD